MSRSKWKSLPAFKPYKKITASRSSLVTPRCVGRFFHIHNGKFLINLQIKNLMVGRKFGEIIFTRKPPLHKK
jgi:ribosomal protein S19